MKRFFPLLSIVFLVLVILSVAPAPAQAGRLGGPASQVSTVPGGTSVYFEIPLRGGEQAIISVVGNRQSILNLYVYDSDGHIVTGNGDWDRRTAIIDVYRGGTFRVEVRNMGIMANTFTISTN